ncbi:MAG: tRNA 2-thiocytidine biosynthesis protein TtcA [Clostridia bacterium]|nr:tRNA 2-thiocytidine biosynthesis protein TtcA [Clostridia bacterium]
MQQTMSRLRRAIDDYNMIEKGEKVAVAISGGKDSALLLAAMKNLSRFHPTQFSVCAVFVDLGFGNIDIDGIKKMCEELDVPLNIKHTEIGKIIFEYRQESNPCALCAKMRRGVIHDGALEMGAKKIALGHHLDDAVETFLLNLMFESRISCFQPVTYLSRKDVTVIRPMIYLTEREVKGAINRLSIPTFKNPCPADGNTKRQDAKSIIKELEKQNPSIKKSIFGALQRSGIDGWGLE